MNKKKVNEAEIKRLKLQKLQLELDLKDGLPHLYSFPFYKWSKQFYDSQNKLLFCTAANQISKSSTQIRKMINWATNKDLWPHLWYSRPVTFWYLYPSLVVARTEVEQKWIPEFLPRGKFKDHPVYGWKVDRAKGEIDGITFNSGVSIIFKSYATQEEMLQTGTVWYLAFDEEMPSELWPELAMRVSAVDGYISGVFTPTLSQQFWYDVMEERGEKERFPNAHKITASLYDSMEYDDGTPSKWNKARINQIMNNLPDDDEIQRRVFGRFIMSKAGLKYPSFQKTINVKNGGAIPGDWLWYYGLDSGSGGENNHPAAIVGIAVSPDGKQGRVAEVWIGTPDNIEGPDKNTTAGDVVAQYVKMSLGKTVVSARYDWADKDMEVIAQRNNVHLEKADKSKEIGEGLVNTLFKNRILNIDEKKETEPLVYELMIVRKEQKKNKAKDDCIDAMRYAVTSINWDLSVITDKFEIKAPKEPEFDPNARILDRRSNVYERPKNEIEAILEEYNELYGDESF